MMFCAAWRVSNIKYQTYFPFTFASCFIQIFKICPEMGLGLEIKSAQLCCWKKIKLNLIKFYLQSILCNYWKLNWVAKKGWRSLRECSLCDYSRCKTHHRYVILKTNLTGVITSVQVKLHLPMHTSLSTTIKSPKSYKCIKLLVHAWCYINRYCHKVKNTACVILS